MDSNSYSSDKNMLRVRQTCAAVAAAIAYDDNADVPSLVNQYSDGSEQDNAANGDFYIELNCN